MRLFRQKPREKIKVVFTREDDAKEWLEAALTDVSTYKQAYRDEREKVVQLRRGIQDIVDQAEHVLEAWNGERTPGLDFALEALEDAVDDYHDQRSSVE